MQWIYWVFAVLVGFWGSFFGAYFKKKGEDRAIQEDIERLTETTKRIEAKISNETWDRQKQWELKRDVLLQGITRIAALDDALSNFRVFVETEKLNRKFDEPEWPQGLERKKQWSKAATDFEETRLLSDIICGHSLNEALDALASFTYEIAAGLTKKDTEIYRRSHAELVGRLVAARSALRKELGIDGPA